MYNFELHITGDDHILDMGKELGLKTISIENLKPDGSVMELFHLTAETFVARSLSEAKCVMEQAYDELNKYCEIYRVKLEVEPNLIFLQDAMYIESHFTGDPKEYLYFPVSRNVKNGKLIYTYRTYEDRLFRSIIESKTRESELELCVFDTNVGQDKEWFKLYETNH